MSGTNDNNNILYLHITPSGKKYFGVTGIKPKQRWQNGRGYRNNSYFWRAIEKYGWNNITHIILADDLTPEEADLFEIFFIEYYDTTNKNKGYNLEYGGRGENKRLSEETKQKISKTQKGRTLSEETKQKMKRNSPNSKTVICITTGKCYESTKEVERITGIRQCEISKVCNGKRKTVGELPDGTRLKWKYVKDLPKPKLTEEQKQNLRTATNNFKKIA